VQSVADVRRLEAAVDAVLAETRIPSLSLAVMVGGWEAFHRTRGLARRDPPRPAREDQPYDLASLTKPLVGATLVASLLEEGRIDLDMPVADVLPEVDGRITLAHLLTHTSGLPRWNAFYADPDTAWGLRETREAILQAARRTRVEATPGTRHAYTDVGFLVLLSFLETLTGQPLDVLFRERVLVPAGVDELRWGWPNAAATERCPVRGVLVEGTVHDLNAAALGGVSTHAGLFAPARAVARLSQRLLDAVEHPDREPRLPGRSLARLWHLRGVGSHAGGWDTPSRDGYTSTGAHFPDDAVGHLGYTGTSLWLVPSRRTIVVLLTNRIHPEDDLSEIRAVRPRLHDAVAEALGWVGD
jgi:serine-type D-Ala-D-Ala carboxypeptidase